MRDEDSENVISQKVSVNKSFLYPLYQKSFLKMFRRVEKQQLRRPNTERSAPYWLYNADIQNPQTQIQVQWRERVENEEPSPTAGP